MSVKNRCCVPFCDRVESIIHRFPVYFEDVYDMWLERVGDNKLKNMDPKYVYKSRYVCDKHFNNECRFAGSKKLKVYSVPTLFLPGSPYEHCFLFPSTTANIVNTDHNYACTTGGVVQSNSTVLSDHDYVSSVRVEGESSEACSFDGPVPMEVSLVRTVDDSIAQNDASALRTPYKKRQREHSTNSSGRRNVSTFDRKYIFKIHRRI